MNIVFEDNRREVIFRVKDFEPKYESILKMCFYEKDGDSYIKKYSNQIKNIKIIQENFKNNAEVMFNQVGYFEDIPWEKALLAFSERINQFDIDWWLTGSCAACIRGIPLNPHDVDIMVDSKDVEQLNNLFSDWMIEPFIDTGGWVTKDFGVLFKYARIDIASDPSPSLDQPEPVDCGPYAKDHLETVLFKGHQIKVPPIQLQINANRRRSRLDRVKLLEAYLNK